MRSGPDPDCACRFCALARNAGDVAGRVANLPHQDVSQMLILRRFDASAYLEAEPAPPDERAGWLTEAGWAAVRT